MDSVNGVWGRQAEQALSNPVKTAGVLECG